jgi:hypothetical protein
VKSEETKWEEMVVVRRGMRGDERRGEDRRVMLESK